MAHRWHRYTQRNTDFYFFQYKYNSAAKILSVWMKRLEAIVSQIESNELDIDELANRLKEAQRLIKYCREKLYKADEEIKKMLEEGQNDEKNAE